MEFINGSMQLSVGGRIKAFTLGGVPGSGGIPSLSPSPLYNEALSKVYDRIRGEVDWAVNAAEARQTLHMVKEYRDHLIPLAEKLEKQAGRLVRFVKRYHPKQWGRRWLEYQYGIKPLVGDIYSTVKQMIDFSSNAVIRVRERSSRTQTGLKVVNGSYGESQRMTWTLSERCQVEACFTIPPSRLISLANYTSLNPVSLAWETFALSFVVDWVFNVGGYLRNLESALLFAQGQSGGFVTHTTRLTCVASVTSNGTESGFTLVQAGNASSTRSTKDRSVLGAGLLPPAFPSFDAKLGSSRLFSAASLLSLHVTKRGGPS
jgi:hypothetical protein